MSDLFASLTPARPAAAPSKGSDFATFKNRPATPPAAAPAPRSYPVEICAVCGKFGSFGFDRFRSRKDAERYACSQHQSQVAKMGVRGSP